MDRDLNIEAAYDDAAWQYYMDACEWAAMSAEERAAEEEKAKANPWLASAAARAEAEAKAGIEAPF
jgi:hypothetical protein